MSSVSSLVALVWPELVTQVAQSSLGRVMKYRASVSAKILLDELSHGTARIEDVADKDEAAAMVFEYMSAAQHGAARRNLRLLAQVFTRIVQQTPPLYADEFLRWSRVLADLSREEIILLATLHKHWQKNRNEPEATIPVNAAKGELVGKYKTFSTDEEFHLTAAALIRTGFLILLPGFEAYPKTTSKLESLLQIVRIDDVLAEDEK
jgi:hypothetical protein